MDNNNKDVAEPASTVNKIKCRFLKKKIKFLTFIRSLITLACLTIALQISTRSCL